MFNRIRIHVEKNFKVFMEQITNRLPRNPLYIHKQRNYKMASMVSEYKNIDSQRVQEIQQNLKKYNLLEKNKESLFLNLLKEKKTIDQLVKDRHKITREQRKILDELLESKEYENLENDIYVIKLKKTKDYKEYLKLKTNEKIIKLLPDQTKQYIESEVETFLRSFQTSLQKFQNICELIHKQEDEFKDLQNDSKLLVGIERVGIQNRILYFKIMEKFGMTSYLPYEKDLLEEIEYKLHNNLPILKEKLYLFMPEVFQVEISDLPEIEQEKIRVKQMRLRPVIQQE